MGDWSVYVLLACAAAGLLLVWREVREVGDGPGTEAQLEELARWRATWAQYHCWLAEHPQVMLVLDNMAAEVRGDVRDLSHPPGPTGPWDVQGLRYWLRVRAARRG